MANACIAYTNLADTAVTITAGSQSLLLPVSNIQVPHVARKWRSLPSIGSNDFILLDYGTSISMDTFAVMGINGNAIRYRLSNTDPTAATAEVYDSGVLTVDQSYMSSIVILPSPLSARYMSITVANKTAANLYVEVGRVFVGLKTQFSYNYVKGWQRTWTDLSNKSKTRGGQTQIFNNAVYRTYDVTFDFLSQSDRDGFVENIDRVNAQKTDVLFIGNPASSNISRDSVWGLMTTLTPVVQQYVGIYSKQYIIEERL
jgi:hypothetical protein